MRGERLPIRFARELGFFFLFLALAVVLTWPLAARLSTAVPDLGDPLLNAWILDWVSYALTHQPLHVFDAPIFHPAKMPLAFSENLIGIAFVMLPFHLAGLPALTIYNIAMLLGFAHAAYGAFVLARVVARQTLPAVIGGIFYGFVSFKFDHLSHLQIIWSGWLPLMLAALIVYWRRRSVASAACLFGAFLMNGLTNIHFLLFGGVALMLAIVVLAVFEPRGDVRFWVQLGAALGLAGLMLLPILLPYRAVADLYEMKRVRGEVAHFSATPSDWLYTTTRSRIYGRYQPPEIRHERTLFPGLFPLFLMAAAIALTRRREDATPPLRAAVATLPRRAAVLLRTLDIFIVILAALVWFATVSERFVITSGGRILLAIRGTDIPMVLLVALLFVRLAIRFPKVLGGDRGHSLRTAVADSRFSPAAWAALLWIVIGILGSLGLNAFFHTFLYQRVEGFAALRVPARWAVITYSGLAIWAALGASALMRRRAIALVLPLFMVADVLPAVRWRHAPVTVPPFYRWLNDVRVGPLLELPPEDAWAGQFLYLLYATEHRVPIMNGVSGFEPPQHLVMRDSFLNGEMNESFTKLIEDNGAKLVVVHGDTVAHHRDNVLTWLRAGLQSQRLAFLRRFDSGIHGDWVFAVTRNLPDWTTYRDFYGDPTALERFLSGRTTRNGVTFGRLETPREYDEVHRELRISGWALSPQDVRSATALLYNGRIRVPMRRFARNDVAAEFPWYPNNKTPGFIAIVPKRPKGFPRDTDVQIELVDGSGRVTRLADVPFRWN